MEQLQKTLNEAIKMGWNLPVNPIYGKTKLVICGKQQIGIHVEGVQGQVKHISYHELFSKDSGLMEFMEWSATDCNVCVNVVFGGKNYDNYDHNYRYWNIEYHYMIMGPMTAQEKIVYFNENAYLSGKQ